MLNKRKLKIVFIGGYQGDLLIEKRRIVRNRSLAGTNKVAAICSALVLQGHEVTIYSEGRVAERTGGWFSAMQEKIRVSEENEISVCYGAAVDIPILSFLVSMVYLFLKFPVLFNRNRFDVAFVYNCNLLSLVSAVYCGRIKKIPVILEYEDSVMASRTRQAPIWKRLFRLNEMIMAWAVKGIYAPSPELAESLDIDNKLVVAGALSTDLVDAALTRKEHTGYGGRLKLLYCGNLDMSKGVDLLMDAVELISHPIEIDICGKGTLESEIKERCNKCKHPAHFHGIVSKEKLIGLQTSADIAVNPHRISWHKGTLWPFKVVECLAGCGVVVCARTGKIEDPLANHLHLYKSDDPGVLADVIGKVIRSWETERLKATANMEWAIEKWGPKGIGKLMEQLLIKAGVTLDL